MIYKWIGKAVVVYGWAFVRRRYRRQLKIGAGVGVLVGAAAIGAAAYVASRDVPEG